MDFGINYIPERTKCRYSSHTLGVQDSRSSGIDGRNLLLAPDVCNRAAIKRGRNSFEHDSYAWLVQVLV